MEAYLDHRDVERERWDAFLAIPPLDRTAIPRDTVKGASQLEPLFEFSGACAGCGETPYLRLVTQLFGDRMIVANATGCSVIYGANLPTTPWTVNAAGRGPAWANSLFEDNAEFGLGMRLGLDAQAGYAALLVEQARAGHRRGPRGRAARQPAGHRARDRRAARSGWRTARRSSTGVDGEHAADARQLPGAVHGPREAGRLDHRWRRLGLRHRLRRAGPGPLVRPQRQHPGPRHRGLLQHRRPGLQGHPARRGRQVRGSRQVDRQEGPRAPIARAYGNVYVAQISMGANDAQTIKALLEADAWPGPSLVIAYSTCIAHGIDMAKSMTPPEGCREVRLLAALPLPAQRGRGRDAVQARQRQAVDARSGTSWPPRPGSPSSSAPTRSGPPSSRSSSRPTPTSDGATTSSWPACTGASRTSRRPMRTRRPWPSRPRGDQRQRREKGAEA